MSLFDAFRRTSRQREPDAEWWTRVRKLESDMDALQRDAEALHESTLTTLRKLAKRAARAAEEDCGCKGESTAADPRGGGLSIREARQRYGTLGGM